MLSDVITWHDYYSQEYHILAYTKDITAIQLDQADIAVVRNEGLKLDFNEIELVDESWMNEFKIPSRKISHDILDCMYHLSVNIFGEIMWEHEDICLVKWYEGVQSGAKVWNTQYNFRFLSQQFNYKLYTQLRDTYSDDIALDIVGKFRTFKENGVWFIFTVHNNTVCTSTFTSKDDMYKSYSCCVGDSNSCDVVTVDPQGVLVDLYEKQK